MSRGPHPRWRHGVPVGDRGPGQSYRPDLRPPSIYAEHQPGVATPQLDRLAFVALDVTVERLAQLRELLETISARARELMSRHNRQSGGDAGRGCGRARTGERTALARAGLTVTVGLGPTIFESGGEDRFGLSKVSPVTLRPLPAFNGDALDSDLCGGDLCLQVCAHDAGLAEEALADLVATIRGASVTRWSQRGLLLRRKGERIDGTPRDVLGFKSGTRNLRRGRDLDRHVWITRNDRTWMLGGTILVVRRIDVLIDAWRSLHLGAQERIIGRHRDTGAPLHREHEFEALPLAEHDSGGLLIPADAHARVAAPEGNDGAVMLRRSYSYDPTDTEPGGPSSSQSLRREAGILFLAFQRDPRRQYVPVQRRLADRDALSAFTRHVGSAIFAIPPGARPGQFLAEPLFSPRDASGFR